MIAVDLIQDDIPLLNLSDDISTAITFFDDYKLDQIPVLEGSSFLEPTWYITVTATIGVL